MTTQQELNGAPDVEKQVIEYLKTHPDFFQHNVSVLAQLRIPHDSGEAVSLLEYQVDTLRKQIKKFERDLGNLIEVARENDRLNDRLHRLTLALLETRRIDDVFLALQDSLRNDFYADVISLRIIPQSNISNDMFTNHGEHGDFATRIILDKDDEQVSELQELLALSRPRCGKLKPTQSLALFNDKADNIASAAIIPLKGCGFEGLLAVASHDPERYHEAMGTVFLEYIGNLVTHALEPYLEGA